MRDIQTIKPRHPVVVQYVSYYYRDVRPDNRECSFTCFPHLNTTISLYRSHRTETLSNLDSVTTHDADAPVLQIFTPVRSEPMRVRQVGPVERIVIVFDLLGIQQFFPEAKRAIKLTD